VKYWQDPVTHYESIKSDVIYAPMSFGGPSIYKQISRADVEVENTAFTKAQIGFASDLSGNFEYIAYEGDGNPLLGVSNAGTVAFGGSGISYPIKTLVPRQKQRCRYLKARWKHNIGYEKYSIIGLSFTLNSISEKGSK
jgi:hypothetical protein